MNQSSNHGCAVKVLQARAAALPLEATPAMAHTNSMSGAHQDYAGILSIGQLARECYGPDKVVLVEFAGGEGTVIAALSTFLNPALDRLEALLDEATGGKEAFFALHLREA